MPKGKTKRRAKKPPAARKPAKKSAAQEPRRTQPKRGPRPMHEKAAVRSDAFAKAILEAKSYRDDPHSLGELFEQASAKAAEIPAAALNELGPYLQTML